MYRSSNTTDELLKNAVHVSMVTSTDFSANAEVTTTKSMMFQGLLK